MTEQEKRERVIQGLAVCVPAGCGREKCPYYDGPESEYWGNPDGYRCEFDLRQDAISLLKMQEQDAQRDYEAAVEMAEYCERYEPTYNPEDGSM